MSAFWILALQQCTITLIEVLEDILEQNKRNKRRRFSETRMSQHLRRKGDVPGR